MTTHDTEESTFLQQYDITKYDRPSIAVDIALFSIATDKPAEDFRSLATKALTILLVNRNSYPYLHAWALPGGFCHKYEDVKATAKRELFEETHVDNAYMKLINAYSDANRDPRGWIISNTFLSLVDNNACTPHAGSDAWESKWFTIQLQSDEIKRVQSSTTTDIEIKHTLSLLADNNTIELTAVISESRHYEANSVDTTFRIIKSELAFDHAKIIVESIIELRHLIQYDKSYIFNIMPPVFTMNDLQTALELITDKKLIKANFNRDMKEYVQDTGLMSTGYGHRPAKLYQRTFESIK